MAKVEVIINTLMNLRISEDEQLAFIVALRHILDEDDLLPVVELATNTKIIKLVRSVFLYISKLPKQSNLNEL